MNSTSLLRSRSLLAAFLIGVSAFFTARLFVLIDQKAVNILFWDQWGFLTPLFEGKTGWWTLFSYQAGAHRMGVGFFLIQLLAKWTHWNTRADAFAILALIFLAMLLAFVLKKRIFGSFSPWDALIPAVFLTAAQYEIFIGTPDESAAAMPLLLLVLLCLAWTIDRLAVRLPLVLALNFGLIFTGYGFLIAPVTIAVFAVELYHAVRDHSRSAMVAAGIGITGSIASVLIYFHDYLFVPEAQCYGFSVVNLVKYPVFMGVVFSKFVGLDYTDQRWPTLILGGLLLAVMLVAFIYTGAKFWARRSPEKTACRVTVILFAYSLVFCASAAVGRVCLGMAAAQSSRYMTLIIPAFLGLYFSILTIGRLGSIPYGRLIALTGVAVIVLLGQLPYRGHDVWVIQFYSEDKASWKNCYLAYEDIPRCNQLTNYQINPFVDADLRSKLDYLKQNRLNLYLDYPPRP